MATSLWTPLGTGIRASIYNPGGPSGTVTPDVCDLTTLDEIELATQAFLDNFTGTNATDLSSHFDDTGFDTWVNNLDDPMLLLDGSAVTTVVDLETSYSSAEFTVVANDGVTLQVDFASFAETDHNAGIVLQGDFNSLSISITCVSGVIEALAVIAGYDNGQTPPITLTFCTWTSLVATWVQSTGTLSITDGTTTESVVLGAGDELQGVNCAVNLLMQNSTANAARIAAIAVNTLGA